MSQRIPGTRDVDELLARSRQQEEETRQKLRDECRLAGAVLAELGPKLGSRRRLLLAEGEYSPSPSTARRWFVIAVDTERPEELAVVWLEEAQRERLEAELRSRHEVTEGMCDAMYATDWKICWTRAHPGSCRVWKRDGLCCEVDGERLRWDEQSLSAGEVDAVEGYVSGNWSERELRLRLRDGQKVLLEKQKDWRGSLDPTYDALNLWCDAAWLMDSARALAEALGVPAECHEERGGRWLPERARE